MATDTLTQAPKITAEPGDSERFSHYVYGGGAAITQAMVDGTPVRALCGKVWVPTRDPKRYPVCPECQEIYDDLPDTTPETP